MSIFIVDSNFFIEAHRATYPLDVAQSFWNKVKQLAEDEKIVSIDKVKIELFDHEDALKHWCVSNLPQDFFKDTTTVIQQYSQVATWAASMSSHYLPSALSEFLDANEADAYLVAYALANSATRIVTTQEISQPNKRNKIKIPEACNAFGVQYCNTIEMFRRLGETF
ncbi:MAG: DUF4411 family protein [Sphingobacteriales bacterium]|nr:MAG: DUF4411 family protein [Sphingobacteriales bacterium]